jgi:hypothetical protein
MEWKHRSSALCVASVLVAVVLAPVARADEFTLEDGPWTDLCTNGLPADKHHQWWWNDYRAELHPPYVEAWADVTCTVGDCLPKIAVSYVSVAKNKRIVWIDHNRPARWRVRSEAYGTFGYHWYYYLCNPMFPKPGGSDTYRTPLVRPQGDPRRGGIRGTQGS